MPDPNETAQHVAYEVDGQIMTAEQVDEAQSRQMQGLYLQFSQMRDRWVQHRANSGVEARWRDATALYYGDHEEATTSELKTILREGPPAKGVSGESRSKVVINIVRPKVDQAEARMCEILFPVDDRNWGIKPTPLPELANMVGNQQKTVDPNTGQPTGLTADDEAQAVIQAAKEAAGKMEKSIDDDLTQCQYNGECRKVIADGVRLGTGILKGPFPTRTTKRAWIADGSGQKMVVEVKITPTSQRVDPWDVFFDPACGNDHTRGAGAWHRRSVTRKEVRALCGVPGYDEVAIKSVLREQPKRIRVADQRVTREDTDDDSYELWEYHGDIEPDEMEFITGQIGDPVKDVKFGVIAMINDRIISAIESWIEDKSLPYDVWTWRKSDSSPYGFGLPDELVHQQRVLNAAWRQVMDNGRVSMGGQIVVNQQRVRPQDGNWTIYPNKVWLANEDVEDVSKAFETYEFASHVQELLAVAQAAINFSDLESGLPQLMGGEKGQAPETVGGMIMLYNNANATLRQRVKLYDDGVTRPHITRYYDFKMANDGDVSIKGDFSVDARGSSALLERDIQNQAMINLANITNMPRYSPLMKTSAELKSILKAFRLNPEELMKTDEQAKQDAANTQQPPDPRVVAAQTMLQAKQMEIADNQQARQLEQQQFSQDDDFRRQQLEYNSQREQAQFLLKNSANEIARDTAILRVNSQKDISQQSLAARERLDMLKMEDGRQRFNAETTLKVRMGSGI